MVDLMATACEWLESNRDTYLSGSITYVRGGTSFVLNATMGSTSYEVDSLDGAPIEKVTKDFIVAIAVFHPIFGKPQIGDIIKQVLNGTINCYEVNTPDGQHAYSEDSYELSYRIRSQETIEFVQFDELVDDIGNLLVDNLGNIVVG